MQGQKDVKLQLKDTAHATTNAKCRLNNVTTEWSDVVYVAINSTS